MGDSFIKIEDLSFSYSEVEENKDFVLKNISLQIEKGEFVAVLGHNGSGKSTLAKLLNMILLPTEGKIYVDGMDITSEDLSDDDILRLRKTVGMVFQNPDNQLVATVVEDDVAFGPENLGVPSSQIRERVDRVLAEVGMSEYAKHEPHRLSGGQKQRVAIAGVMAMMPEYIIFDESTAMLDPKGRAEIVDTLIKLNKEKGITVILITHYMEEAEKADRVIVMNDGKIIDDGIPAEIFKNVELLKSVGLDVPQTTELLYALQKEGFDVNTNFISIQETAEEIYRALA